jgi:hypothetical protein
MLKMLKWFFLAELSLAGCLLDSAAFAAIVCDQRGNCVTQQYPSAIINGFTAGNNLQQQYDGYNGYYGGSEPYVYVDHRSMSRWGHHHHHFRGE